MFKKERDCAALWLGFPEAPVWSWLSLTSESCPVSNKDSTHWNPLWNLQLTLQQKEPDAAGLGWVQDESSAVSSTWLNMDRMKGLAGCSGQWNSSMRRRGLGETVFSAQKARGAQSSWVGSLLQLWVTHLIAALLLQTGPPCASCWALAYHWTAPLFQRWKGNSPEENALEGRKPMAFPNHTSSQVLLQKGIRQGPRRTQGAALRSSGLEPCDYHLPGPGKSEISPLWFL